MATIPRRTSKSCHTFFRATLSCVSRHGHVVVDGEGSGDNPAGDIWVSNIAFTQHAPLPLWLTSTPLPRNMTTTVSFGPELAYHQAAHLVAGVQSAVLIHVLPMCPGTVSTTRSTWLADTTGTGHTLYRKYGV